ncbi:hypothetical protein ACEPAI_3920 [Sanghuangporus weigelae]
MCLPQANYGTHKLKLSELPALAPMPSCCSLDWYLWLLWLPESSNSDKEVGFLRPNSQRLYGLSRRRPKAPSTCSSTSTRAGGFLTKTTL